MFFCRKKKTPSSRSSQKSTRAKKAHVLVGELATFNALFDAIVRVKQDKKVINNAVALRLLAELAVQQLDAEKLAEPIVPDPPKAKARKTAAKARGQDRAMVEKVQLA